MAETSNYLMFHGKPLVREGQQIFYGSMDDKYILFLGIMTTKEINGKQVPDDVMIQIQSTGPDHKVVRVGKKNGLYEAFEFGRVWLDSELKKA